MAKKKVDKTTWVAITGKQLAELGMSTVANKIILAEGGDSKDITSVELVKSRLGVKDNESVSSEGVK